jgi:hypothetical protein
MFFSNQTAADEAVKRRVMSRGIVARRLGFALLRNRIETILNLSYVGYDGLAGESEVCIVSVYANVTVKGFAPIGERTRKLCFFSPITIKMRNLRHI